MPQESKEIKFRAPTEFGRRLQWALYCEGGISQQEAMVAALSLWLDQMEQKWGRPVEPTEVSKSGPSPKLVGSKGKR